MKPKLLIINNGLKDLRGHYFETSISIAEAAHRLGYHPILATHATCQPGIIPDWVEFYPVFCTDHWMLQPPVPPPDLHTIRGNARALYQVSIDTVLQGSATVHDYLVSRFEPMTFPELVLPTPPGKNPVAMKDRVRGLVGRSRAVVRGLVPPALLPPFRRLRQYVRELSADVKGLLRASLPPLVYDSLRRLRRRMTHRRHPANTMPLPTTDGVAHRDPLAVALEQIDALREFEYTRVFQRDLERLLCLTGATNDDHVFMPTAHGRELVAVQRLLAAIGEADAPVFHLEFRHAMDMTGCFADPAFVHPYTTQHRVLFDHSRRVPPSPKVRLYTDTKELTQEYEHFSGHDFGVLPIPFRVNLIRPGGRPENAGLCIAYFGDVRDEKGFYHLPAVVADLMADYVVPGKVRFLVQASLSHPEWNPRSAAALEKLRAYPAEHIRLLGLDRPLPPEEYFRLVSEADLLLCPYSPFAYKRRSSGTLTEAIAAGIPTVVPANTWLAGQQPPGTGEQFCDEPSLVAAVRKILADYAQYLEHARRAKDEWLAVHSPEQLVKRLIYDKGAGFVTTRCKVA
jgi:glycosyltransferase involved in cell wall biosynthesis